MRKLKFTTPVWLHPKSLTGRLLFISLAWLVIALTLGGYLISNAFRSHVEEELDSRLGQTLDVMVGMSDFDGQGNIVFSRDLSDQRFDEPYSGWYWQVSAEGEEPYRSRSLWDQALDLNLGGPAFTGATFEAEGPGGRRIRVMVRDIILPGSERVFRYAVAGDASEMRAHIARFDRIILWSLGILGTGIILAMFLQLAIGLSPLREVRKGLSEIRTGSARRLSRDCPPEIEPLVNEMNAVLAHNETLIERARTQIGNLAHALKTPLTVLTNETSSSPNSRLGQAVEKQIATIRRHVDYHLARARAMGHARHIRARTQVGKSAKSVARTVQRLYRDKDLKIQFDIERGLKFLGERQDLEEILGNLVDNAAKWGKGKVRISGRRLPPSSRGAQFMLSVEDDGPGIQDPKHSRALERGKRLDDSVPGSGLGLAIVRDLAKLYGGRVKLARSPLGGLKVEVLLPAENVPGKA